MSQPLSSLVPTSSPQQVAQAAQGVQYVQVPQQSVQYVQQPQQYVVKETVVTESCPVKPACPPPKPVCKPACDPCAEQNTMQGWGWLAALVMWFILLTVFLWLIIFSLRPSWVLNSGTQQVDTAKVLLAAVIGAVILLVIFWLIKLAVSRAW